MILEEPITPMYNVHPNGSIHTQSGMIVNCTLRIHTNDVNHGHHMNIVDPCKVSIMATDNTQWIYVTVYKVR